MATIPPEADAGHSNSQSSLWEGKEYPGPGATKQLPTFKDLPLQSHHPRYSAWGLWGKYDEAGTLVRDPLQCHICKRGISFEVKMITSESSGI